MNLVRKFDGMHIRLLRTAELGAEAVADYISSIDGSRGDIVLVEGSAARLNKPCERTWKELFEEGLTYTDSRVLELREQTRMTGGTPSEVDLRTPFGCRFLDFIGGVEDRAS